MEQHSIKKGIHEIREVSMTREEKAQILQRITTTPMASPYAVRSVWSLSSFTIRHRTMTFASLVLIILLASGSGVAFASGASLPNSILYPIKVKIIEPLKGSLIFSPVAKAKYESSLATTRLVEAETLASEGKLDVDTEQKINSLLEDHAVALDAALVKVKQSESPDKSEEITTNFYAEMNAHARVLDIINENGHKSQNQNEDQDKEDSPISHTARTNAKNAKESLLEANISKDENPVPHDVYKKRTEAVQSLIDQTTTLLNQENNNHSRRKRKVIDNTNDTLNAAKQSLDNVNTDEGRGNKEDKYRSLIDSESSAKEANLFLKIGSQLKDRGGDEEHD